MDAIPLALSYEDVLLVPARSRIRSRQQVDISSRLTPRITLNLPIVSANMDTVTTAPMAIAMAKLGGIGVLHRFAAVEEQAREVERVKRHLSYIIRNPYTVRPDLDIGAARAEATSKNVTGLIVADEGRKLLGILTARDLRAASDEQRVADAMTPQERLVTAPVAISLAEARDLMHRHRIEKLPLVDETGMLSGLITLRDISLRAQYPTATRDDQGRLRVAAAVGVNENYLARADALLRAHVDAVVVDIAHGHAEHTLDAITDLRKTWPELELIAGNVATAEGVEDLVTAGADTVKVGIGPGFACSTRLVAGVGIPQFTAVLECAQRARALGAPVIADGGIRHPADVAKAIGAGASSVMVGNLLAGREESPGEVVRRQGRRFKIYRGMASRSAAAARLALEGRTDALDQYVPEGEEMEFPLRGPVAEIVTELAGGLRSGMSYVDAGTVEELWDKARFVRQTQAGRRESKPGKPDD